MAKITEDGTPYRYGLCHIDNGYKLNITRQTALDWFFNLLPEKTQANNEKEYWQAKAMDKEQHNETWISAINKDCCSNHLKTFEEYYIKTYKNN